MICLALRLKFKHYLFGTTVELATSDLGSCDKSLQPTYLKSPCRIPIFPMYSSSAHPTRYNRQIATYDMICPVPWGVYLLYLTRHNRHFFPKHFRPQPKSNRVRAMFLTAYVCHKRDQQLVMRCQTNSVELVTRSVGHSRRVYLIVAGSLFVFLVNFLFELVSES